ncbi:MAG: ethylbenzene dehydrogenase-related protein [Candidatus Kariarchaeaceae archaeon]|jgi:hypothetical protein
MKKIIATILLITIFTSTPGLIPDVNQTYDNYIISNPITIDGDVSDWLNVSIIDVILKPARVSNEHMSSFNAEFSATHDADKIYFLVVIKDDPYYFYNINTGISHRYAAALAVAFPIDEGAMAQYMGGSGRDTVANIEKLTGEVDIMHWELDTIHGVTAGGTKNTTAGASFGDGIGNMDDEFAYTAEFRRDDNETNSENSYSGVWDHTSDYQNGSTGDWIFEFSRDLITCDPRDAQFIEGNTIEVALAFWTPNENTNKKWTDDGHFVNYDNVIEMNFPISSSTNSTSSTAECPTTSSTTPTTSTTESTISSGTTPISSTTESAATTSSAIKSMLSTSDSPSSEDSVVLGFGFDIFLGISSLFLIMVLIKRKQY